MCKSTFNKLKQHKKRMMKKAYDIQSRCLFWFWWNEGTQIEKMSSWWNKTKVYHQLQLHILFEI